MKCKTSYVKAERLRFSRGEWVGVGDVYEAAHGRYIRSIRTAQEIRRNNGDEVDAKEERLSVKIRRSRCGYSISSWNLEPVASMTHKRSWKAFFRCRKQWMKNR